MINYIIQSGISDYVSLNPFTGMAKFGEKLIPWKYVVVTYFVDPARGDWYGFDREYFGFYPKNYDSGEITYPDNFDPTEHYWIDNLCYYFNFAFLMFMCSVFYNVVSNLRDGISAPLRVKMSKLGKELGYKEA